MKEPLTLQQSKDEAAQKYSEGIANDYEEQVITKGQLKLYAKKDFKAGFEYRQSFIDSLRGKIEAERNKMISTMQTLEPDSREFYKREDGVFVCDEILNLLNETIGETGK